MVASASTIPVGVIYLLLVFFQGFGSAGPVDVEYLQDGVPALTVTAAPEAVADGRVYRIVALPSELSATGDDAARDEAEVRVEQSDLVSQNYLVYAADRTLPVVVTVGPVLAQLASVSPARDLTLELPDAGELVAGEGETALGATLHVLRRDGVTFLSAPDSGIALLIEHE